MPDVPSETVTDVGVHNYQYTQGERSWIASYAKLQGEFRGKASRELLDEIREGFLKLLPDSRLVSTDSGAIAGFPGITCVIETQAAWRPVYKLKMKALVTKERFITFGYASLEAEFNESEADEYLSTFELR